MSNERTPFYNVRRVPNRCNQIDTHELLKREIMKQGSDSGGNPGTSNMTVNSAIPAAPIQPSAPSPSPAQITNGVDDTYIYFDSQTKDLSSDLANGAITWNLTNLNNQQPVQNIIEMKVGSFYFPLISNDVALPDYYFFRRIYMRIDTLPTNQSVLAQNNMTYHYEFDVDNLSSIAVKLTPVNDTIYFTNPVVSLEQMAMRFLIPPNFRKIAIPNDNLSVTAIAGTNPGQFTINGLDDTSGIGAIGVLTAPGVAAFFSGFVSPNATINNTVNSLNGQFITTVISASTFSVAAFDFSTLLANVNCNALIGKNRIAVPMRFTSVMNATTNYLVGTHH